jgi:hypothetical protein
LFRRWQAKIKNRSVKVTKLARANREANRGRIPTLNEGDVLSKYAIKSKSVERKNNGKDGIKMNPTIEELAAQERREYFRAWRAANKEKTALHRRHYWEKRALVKIQEKESIDDTNGK